MVHSSFMPMNGSIKILKWLIKLNAVSKANCLSVN